MKATAVFQLLTYVIGEQEATDLMSHVALNETLLGKSVRGKADRATVALTLNLVLFHDLIRRVPSARRYLREFKPGSEKIVMDHGAVRTVRLDGMGSLPSGESSITRLLEPMGYAFGEEYPLATLKMIGRSYRHIDHPDDIPQFFVSEILPERFSAPFQAAAAATFSSSLDPLDATLRGQLDCLALHGSLAFHDAADVVLKVARCFDRHHESPKADEYQTLLNESAEMAWISTEGNTYNHATIRVGDVQALHTNLIEAGFPVKPAVEVSASGNVLQTALIADGVPRRLRSAASSFVERLVPGSFCEFIERRLVRGDDGVERRDLRFDSMNATGIFKMTAAGDR